MGEETGEFIDMRDKGMDSPFFVTGIGSLPDNISGEVLRIVILASGDDPSLSWLQ